MGNRIYERFAHCESRVFGQFLPFQGVDGRANAHLFKDHVPRSGDEAGQRTV